MKLPSDMTPYQVSGCELRHMETEDKASMVQLQSDVLALLPDPRWYYPSDDWEFDEWLEGREAVGFVCEGDLAAYAVMTPADIRGEHSYARVLGEPAENTFDFHDVLVRPAYRGRGMHTKFLALFTQVARASGGKAIYATVDPDNSASWRNFEKAGYECIRIQPAYDGRVRRYYRLTL